MKHDELRKERERLGLDQVQMAAKLNNTSVHTYRKWEQGQRKVPSWVPPMLVPRELDLSGLALEDFTMLDEIARAHNLTLAETIAKLLRKGIKTGLGLILLGFLSYLCAPKAVEILAALRDAADLKPIVFVRG